MESFLLATYYKPTCIDLFIDVEKPCRVRVIVYNPKRKKTVYFDRTKNVDSFADFNIKVPRTPYEMAMDIVTDNGSKIKVEKLKRKKFTKNELCTNGNGWNGKKTREFLRFAQDFCENLSSYAHGTYYSDNKNFRIDLFDVIRDNGKVNTTPARIHNRTGRMEVSKDAFIKMTVPKQMVILLHEFAHFNLNNDHSDEIEADLNALKIYLGAGYPTSEGYKGFLEVFMTHPSNQNRERFDVLDKFITNFENSPTTYCL